MNSSKHVKKYFDGIKNISNILEKQDIEDLVKEIFKIKKKGGRIFFLGVGGSAGNASHAVNDFRKICEIEAYTPTDNVSEFSARINDDGWNTSFLEWLKISKLSKKDAIFILSVGGGNRKKKVSLNLVEAIKYAKKIKSGIFGIVGRDGGFTKIKGDKVILIPNVNPKLVTPFAEAYQAVVWHCLVSHPLLQKVKTKW
jgi:D-sedoheptulose 7-phosphate isomerase